MYTLGLRAYANNAIRVCQDQKEPVQPTKRSMTGSVPTCSIDAAVWHPLGIQLMKMTLEKL